MPPRSKWINTILGRKGPSDLIFPQEAGAEFAYAQVILDLARIGECCDNHTQAGIFHQYQSHQYRALVQVVPSLVCHQYDMHVRR
jgi:hypothetical protein